MAMVTLSIRITEQLDDGIREAAIDAGDSNLSRYVQRVLADAVKTRFPKKYAAEGAPKLCREKSRRTVIRRFSGGWSAAEQMRRDSTGEIQG